MGAIKSLSSACHAATFFARTLKHNNIVRAVAAFAGGWPLHTLIPTAPYKLVFVFLVEALDLSNGPAAPPRQPKRRSTGRWQPYRLSAETSKDSEWTYP